MTSRKRLRQFFTGISRSDDSQNLGPSAAAGSPSSVPSSARSARMRRSGQRLQKRRHLLETLESRQMLAGPQLIGIQPNEGDLIVDGSVRNVAPRSLTFRFDEVQQIDPATFSGIQIVRAGTDLQFDTSDDVTIVPGLVTLGDIRKNEVVVRFNENLPDDKYRISVSAVDNAAAGTVALRNSAGETFQPDTVGARSQETDFTLSLGALVESIVPQPVVRLADGTLQQRPKEILVYFNEDQLFVENDSTGKPTARSAENPRFYQLLYTKDTVRTTDDVVTFPQQVIYDSATNTARLIFSKDINDLATGSAFGGTFRLRVGSAINSASEFNVAPTRLSVPEAGDTIGTSYNVGALNSSTSIIVSGQIDPQAFGIQLPGSPTDPGRQAVPEGVGSGLSQIINDRFGPDSTAGITTIAYNFQAVFAGGTNGTPSQLNNITEVEKQRIREALSLWAKYLGVQFRETKNAGVTFAVGNVNSLPDVAGLQSQTFPQLDAKLRIDPNFNTNASVGATNQSAMVFSSQPVFKTAYGENFFRKAMTGIGFLLGLEQSSDLTAQTLMSLDTTFINETIDPTTFSAPVDSFLPVQTSRQQSINDAIDSQTIDKPVSNALSGSEPVFPGNYDILHGQLLYRPDGNDVDLYRFQVQLASGVATGSLDVESFAERLPDSSLLNTELTLYKEQNASANYDFGIGSSLIVNFAAQQAGTAGNNARINFIQTTRTGTDTAIKITRVAGNDGKLVANAIQVDIPRLGGIVSAVPVSAVINAINADAFAKSLFTASLVSGAATTNIAGSGGNYSPVLLSGGGLTELARNDDYFSDDSLLKAELGNGVYYIGISASGNDTYDPMVANSGFGGKTQGKYDLQIRFLPQIGQFDSIRDRDTARAGVPGTAIDGDGDGTPGGVKNFWFQTRPADRMLEVTANGATVVPGQTFTITGASGVSRTFELSRAGAAVGAGNVRIDVPNNINASPLSIANVIFLAVKSVQLETGVSVSVNGAVVTLHGERSLTFSQGFSGIEVHGRTLFVDKTASVVADGTQQKPFNTIANPAVPNAFGVTFPGDIVRIVGNGGQDKKLETTADNFSYQIGVSENNGSTLADGRNLEVPKGVTVMIDEGAEFKFRNAFISAGSTNLQTDRSGGAIQILGTPRQVTLTDATATSHGIALIKDSLGKPVTVSGNVVFTSTRDRSVDSASSGNSPAAAPGNWGGIIFRRDVDASQGRTDLEDEGIFLQVVNHADIRFGGGSNILIESVQQTVNPIQLVDLRPTITFNRLTSNSSAAISATPDSFEESSFQAPRFQQAGQFTPDYGRVGPDINNNLLTDNSINGLFIRTETVPGKPLRQLTVAGRFDDVDIVHYIAENIVVVGTPGGSIQDGVSPDFTGVGVTAQTAGALAAGSYTYRMTFVDANGFESLASLASTSVAVAASGAVQLVNLPAIVVGSDYVSRRVYRSKNNSTYTLAAELPSSGSTFVDNGKFNGATLDLTRTGIRGRLDASLVVDPGTVVKFRGARLELGQGTQLLAEGLPGRPVVFTSALDDRYGGGGSFDTNNDRTSPNGGATPQRGDWSGIYASPNSNVSIDNSVIAYGGGVSLIEGGQSRGFLALELQQANGRVTNTRFEFNDSGKDGSGPIGRNGRLAITPATIYVRGSQPTLVNNQFVNNYGSIIDIDLGSMTDQFVQDLGRQTGLVSRFAQFDDNQGPLIRLNTTSSPAGSVEGKRQLNGLRIRGGQLTSGSVWDDTDIDHVLFDSVIVGNQVSGGALTLKSRADQSLVIKLLGGGTPNSPTLGTGFTATGSTGDISDRIGGTIYVLGLAGSPVVFTSYNDDSIGSGRRLDGVAQTDTNGDGVGSRPSPNDWRSLYFDGLSNDRNLAALQEIERTTELAPGLNGNKENAEFIGSLAERLTSSDDSQRLGFDVRGYLSAPQDIDTYSFSGVSGTQVWIDVDRTTFALDTVLEVLDPNGVVVARSNNSFDEFADPTKLFSTLSSSVAPLADQGPYAKTWGSGLYSDFGSTNPRDAGLRLALPGTPGLRNNYFVRVRSASINPDDAQGGTTKGAYNFQVRLQEKQEFAGSVVQFADIRFANNGIHLQSLPGSSPLLGEAQENEAASPSSQSFFGATPGGNPFDTVLYDTNVYANNDVLNGGISFPAPTTGVNQTRNLLARPQNVGNLVDSKTGTISVGGSLSAGSDVDFYQVDLNYDSTLAGLQRSSVFDVDYAAGLDRPDTNLSIFYSPTGRTADARLVLFGQSSNLVDDQSSPLASVDIGELLSRGSVANGDPFVGPVSLPQGSYFVAVTESGRIPTELTANTSVRREPIDSLLRIFEDHIESVGGSTASAPSKGNFVASATAGWSTTNNRSNDPGHQFTTSFNGSKSATTAYPPSNQFETETNDTFVLANNLDTVPFSLAFDPNIGSTTANTSQTIPHTRVSASTINDVADLYKFVVTTNNSNVIIDVDNGYNPVLTTDPNSIDLKLELFRETVVGGVTTRTLVQSSSNEIATFGALGSGAGFITGTPPVFLNTNLSADPYIQTTLVPGVYYVAVTPEATVYDPATETFTLVAASRPLTGTYDLNLSVENHTFAGGAANNQSYRFDRSNATGTLTSTAFDLTGYAAADVPRIYFDYFYSPALGDTVSVTAQSTQHPIPVNLGINFQQATGGFSQTWRQAVSDLSALAGDTNIVLKFQYNTNPLITTGEGLYLDNFIVGFAERGEMVSGASLGSADFSNSFSASSGQYQLEMRPGTNYVTQGQGGIQLAKSFDTNDRQTQQLTLIAPAGAAITSGDRFVLGDGNRNLTFEFTTGAAVAAGNIRVQFATTDTAATIARRIIDAINSGVVQTADGLSLKASTASGAWDFSNNTNLPTDARIALQGPAVGKFASVANLAASPATPARNTDGTLRLAAIYAQGTGDSNTVRTQGEVIVDSNKVSDVRAIGIWSDVGFRGTDPEDSRNPFTVANGNYYLDLPPVGNSQLGAALNLPTINNSVAGGIAPGVTVVNNIVDQAGFTGVKVDGETRPFVIEWNGDSTIYSSGTTLLDSRGDISVPDGFMFAIDAGGTRVVFEFDDISGAPPNLGGSGQIGGDGVVDGHVPIYYRLGKGATYNPSLPSPLRNTGYSAQELMMAIYESIEGSILVTNGLVELVRPTIGPSLTSPYAPHFRSIDQAIIPTPAFSSPFSLDFANPAIYLQGVTGIYSSYAFQKAPYQQAQLNIIQTSFDFITGQTSNQPFPVAPIYEAPQPLARIINNTVYGADGTEAGTFSDGSISRAIEFPTTDSGDTIATALDTKQGRSHRGAYSAQGTLGDNTTGLAVNLDVDFYKVELSVGDRLIVDIDTLSGTTTGPTAAIRLFDSRGIAQAAGTTGEVADNLKPGGSVEFPKAAVNNARDRFLDFTATSTGTYYIGISSAGNESYDAQSLTGRTAGTGGTGAYTIGIDVLAPRSFVLSLDNSRLTPFGAEVTQGDFNGTNATGGFRGQVGGPRSLIGTTITISQIPDYLVPTRAGDAYKGVVPDGNRVVFEFTNSVNAIVLPNGHINVPLLTTLDGGFRTSDIMRALANAINGYVNNPALPNHENGNGPGGASGPVSRVKARALGGSQVDNTGIHNYVREVGYPSPPVPVGGGIDFTSGFGHDRRESGNTADIVPDGSFTDSQGGVEIYALIENAANIELSPEARAAGLKIGPDDSKLANGNLRNPTASGESDQVLTEFGILISGGASAAILNNVVINAHQSIVKDETSVFGFGGRIDAKNPDLNVKPSQVVLTGNTIEYADERNTQIRQDLSWWIGNGINVVNRNPVLDSSLSTDLRTGPSNIAGGNSDFNFVVRPQGTPGQSPGNFIVFTGTNVLEDPAANLFTPVVNTPVVDSAIDSIQENTALSNLKNSVGIPSGLIIAPKRDNSGQLRADDPLSAPPGGLGSNVFKDRGALDRADFVGPSAVLDSPIDNDAARIDTDPTSSFVQLKSGTYQEFRVQLRDTGDASDPFVGSGIDNDTVVVPVIPGLRASGANIALFEGDRLLTEGIDYTFSYDSTKNLITLRPIAGIWRNDQAYRISLNNRDRIVGLAPSAGQVADGDSFTVTDSQGGKVNFEYESGYQLATPEALQITVPTSGTGSGGISDGDLFSITRVDGLTVVFEFDRDGIHLNSTQIVPFALGDSPTKIAASIRTAIAAAKTANLLDVDVDTTAVGPTVVIGSEAGTVLDASKSGLINNARTIGLQVPTAGAGPAGVNDGDVLTISDGNSTVAFEFEISGGLNNQSFISIPIAGLAQATAIRDAIATAIASSSLRLSTIGIGNILYLNLPLAGSVSVSRSQLSPVGISRTPADGDTIQFTSADGTKTTFELTRNASLDDANNIRVDFTRLNTGFQLASSLVAAIKQRAATKPIGQLDAQSVQANPGGLISVGGDPGLLLTLKPASTILVSGNPGVTSSTLLTISGPLLLQIPIVGGSGIPDDSQFTLTDGTKTVTFVYNINLTTFAPVTATAITYQTFEDSNTIAAATVAAIKASGLNVVVTDLGGGLISLGTIADNQVSFPVPTNPAPISPRRGIVNDGERIVITQAGQSKTFEFESSVAGGGVRAGSIPVVFQSTGKAEDVANVLAAAINNNRGTFSLTATAIAGGQVRLTDTPQTTTDVSAAPTITLSGRPGGAIPVVFTGSFTADDIKRSTIDAINNANAAGKTTLTAEDRGGSTFFIENGALVEGQLRNYFLQGIKDVAGNFLEPNRADRTTKFTLLLPTIGLDYGDAPDPLNGVPGRYPTLLQNDGPRHIINDQLKLGKLVDTDTNGLPNVAANGDDTTIFFSKSLTAGAFFVPTLKTGYVDIAFNLPASPLTADGNTVTLSTGVHSVTFEFDTNGIFNEENYAVAVDGTKPITPAIIAEAFRKAVAESPLNPADVVVDATTNTVHVVTADEDGVVFTSLVNPNGIINPGVPLPITVTVTGSGILEGWIDFNFDGDFNDPNEQIISRDLFPKDAVFSSGVTTHTFTINVPATAAKPLVSTTTYARFRVSTEGGLAPTGLALSGEVEDYALTILPGLPPTVNTTNNTLTYSVDEDGILFARDTDGTLTPSSSNDDGALSKIKDPDAGDAVGVFASDVGNRTLLDSSGKTAGALSLFADGTFTFQPATDYFGNTQFSFRVTDLKPNNPSTQLVSPIAMTVNLTIKPVNDRPFVTSAAPTTTVSVAEDTLTTFLASDLTKFYSAGPANEASQILVIQSAGVNGNGFQTKLGGTLTLSNGNLQYTPPANFPGPGKDEFTYVVADDPNDLNQLVQSAVTLGTVTITITPVNDAPFAGTDSYTAAEDTPLTIPITGVGGILSNDNVGPADEVASGQKLTLKVSEFPKSTDRGGRVALSTDGKSLVYTPATNFSGQDQFTYTVSDDGSPVATAIGTVLIDANGTNDPPVFVGVNGDVNQQSIQLNESKATEQVIDYNLSSWFIDPEGDKSTFQVTSSDTSIVKTQVILDSGTGISTLRLTLPSYRFGDLSLNVIATNVAGPASAKQVPVKVINTPDPPTIIGALNPVNANEDAIITRNLATIFNDPDGSQLTYKVTRLGTLLNPTAAQIAASPLLNTITFVGDIMTITLDADASGSVDVEIAANDGTFQVPDAFTLTVSPTPDAPRGTADFYNVPIGARFEIIDPTQGLVGNDTDPDGDLFAGSTLKVRVDTTSVTQPAKGTVTVNADGTFAYTSTGGAKGETDTFTYRPIDPTGLIGAVTTVTFNLGQSRYQNPIPGFRFDVTADGNISPLDALRILNRIRRYSAETGKTSIPVSALTTAPPDFLDVDGDGFVKVLDALNVINEISRRRRAGNMNAEGENSLAQLSSTVAYAAPSNIGLAETNRQAPLASNPTTIDNGNQNIPYDPFAAGFDVIDRRVDESSAELIQLNQSSESSENTVSAFDEVLSSWSEPTNL